MDGKFKRIIKPTGNRLLLEELEIEKSGEIFLPRGALQLSTSIGRVLSTGPGYEKSGDDGWDPCHIKKGELVLFNAQAGLRIPRELSKTKELILLQETQVMAIVEDVKED